MPYDPSNDPVFDAAAARVSAAGNDDVLEKLSTDIGARREENEHPLTTGLLKIPKNIGIGAWKALINTIDTASDIAAQNSPTGLGAKAVGGDEARQALSPSLSEAHPELMKHLKSFTDDWERNDTMRDDVTQGLSQFALPFAGWMKAMGPAGSAMMKFGQGLAAEGATAGSAFDPHDPRMTDLLKMGQEYEGRLGNFMRNISPDGSLMNSYINYMTSREGVTPQEKREGVTEGKWEGRFKNAADSVGGSAAIAGILKFAGHTFKSMRSLSPSAPGRIGPSSQKGQISFHGSGHDFEKFDASKIGTGEGAKAFGHGLYFAENPDVANVYAQKLGKLDPGEVLRAKKYLKDIHGEAASGYQDPRGYIRAAENTANPKTGKKDFVAKTDGKLYEVHIPDEKIAEMVDFDTEMSKQPHILEKLPAQDRESLQSMLDEHDQGDLADLKGNQFNQLIAKTIQEGGLMFEPASGIYDDGKALTAEYLQKNGIPGISFLDGMSRKAGKGTRNFVLFSGDDVEILKKNGQPVKVKDAVEEKSGA